MTEGMARLTAPFINPKRRLPLKRYTGKFSIPRASIAEKTILMMTIVPSGLRMLQRYPKTLRRYFSLISRDTSWKNSSRYFKKL
jgi:hypothetical protein